MLVMLTWVEAGVAGYEMGSVNIELDEGGV